MKTVTTSNVCHSQLHRHAVDALSERHPALELFARPRWTCEMTTPVTVEPAPIDYSAWTTDAPQGDPVSAPSHYMKFGLSPQTLIEAFGLAFPEGNAIKYLARAKHKGNEIEDLKKAVWYALRAYELACAKRDGRPAIGIDNKQDTDNPFGAGFLRDLTVAQEAVQ